MGTLVMKKDFKGIFGQYSIVLGLNFKDGLKK